MDGDSRHIITPESSKGLEYPFVMVPFVDEEHYPAAWEKKAALSSQTAEALLELSCNKMSHIGCSCAATKRCEAWGRRHGMERQQMVNNIPDA